MSTLTIRTWTHFWSLVLTASLCVAAATSTRALAQSYDPGEGIARITDWPELGARDLHLHDILPFIDTLTVAYRYHAADAAPVLALSMDWVPSGVAIYEGKHTELVDIEGDVRMVAVDLLAGVYVDQRRVADLSVVVDSMVLGPSPDKVEIELPNLTWDNVFVGVSPEEARTIYLNGFELGDLEITGAAFAVLGGDEQTAEARDEGSVRRVPPPRRVSVYRGFEGIDIFFDLYWLIGDRARSIGRSGREARGDLGRGSLDSEPRSRSGRARGERSRDDSEPADEPDRERDDRGRAGGDSGEASSAGAEEARAEGRSGSRDRGGIRLPDLDDDDDEDDDDDRLVPYAVAAVGAAGLVALVGGTLGYYGNSRYAPLGLTSGIVRREGGLLLQVGVNEALLFNDGGPKRLMVKLLSFGNFLRSGLQPALGGGVLATSRAGEPIAYEPSVSVGAVGRYEMLLFYGGYDVLQNGPEFSLALNFRALWQKARSKAE